MKVVAINGSPRVDGNTACALEILGSQFNKQGIEFEVVQVGNCAIRGCMGCGGCAKAQNEQCIYNNDPVNAMVQKLKDADGIIIASPVYFSGIAGTMKSFLDRLFYVCGANGGLLRGKVGAAIATVRRSGGSHTLDGLNHYITYAEMILATSMYWNIVHGRGVGEMPQDFEGVQTMEVLADNMAWIMKMKNQAAIPQPERAKKIYTSLVK